MKNKNGFTLVELLAVIVILALIMMVIVPNALKAGDSIKQKSFETKKENIESAAQIYGIDLKDFGAGNKCIRISDTKEITYAEQPPAGDCYEYMIKKVSEIADAKYIKYDIITENNKYVASPLDNSLSLNNDYVFIYKKKNRVYALYKENTEDILIIENDPPKKNIDLDQLPDDPVVGNTDFSKINKKDYILVEVAHSDNPSSKINDLNMWQVINNENGIIQAVSVYAYAGNKTEGDIDNYCFYSNLTKNNSYLTYTDILRKSVANMSAVSINDATLRIMGDNGQPSTLNTAALNYDSVETGATDNLYQTDYELVKSIEALVAYNKSVLGKEANEYWLPSRYSKKEVEGGITKALYKVNDKGEVKFDNLSHANKAETIDDADLVPICNNIRLIITINTSQNQIISGDGTENYPYHFNQK